LIELYGGLPAPWDFKCKGNTNVRKRGAVRDTDSKVLSSLFTI
jgi:hypothetical protein